MGALVLSSGCNKKQLKKPASTGGGAQKTDSNLNKNEVREMARVFAQEFAAELKRQNVSVPVKNGESTDASSLKGVSSAKVILDSAPDVMAFYLSLIHI